MHTHETALAYITEAIEATGVIPDAAADYDLDAIADELHTATGGWDLTNLDTETFWAAIQRHALHAGQDTDDILTDLAYAAEQVTTAREALRAAEAARDELLTRAAHTGTLTQSRLARAAGLTRARVHQIINR